MLLHDSVNGTAARLDPLLFQRQQNTLDTVIAVVFMGVDNVLDFDQKQLLPILPGCGLVESV